MTHGKVQSTLSNKSVALKAKIAKDWVMLAISTSLNDTECHMSKTSRDIWINLTTYVICIRSYKINIEFCYNSSVIISILSSLASCKNVHTIHLAQPVNFMVFFNP
jgi:hypothetical protein